MCSDIGGSSPIEETNRSLLENNPLFKMISSISLDGILMVDENQRIIFFNNGAENIFGYSQAEVLGQSLDMLIPHRFTNAHQKHVSHFKEETSPSRLMKERLAEIYGLRKSGEEIPLEVSISKWEQDNHSFFVAICRDISEKKKKDQLIQKLAHFDSLTGLTNRALFQDRLQQAILIGKRENRPMALFFMDLDRFKEINDTLGHHSGDILLQTVAERLRKVVRQSDVIARFGGDEFAVLLVGTLQDGAILAAKRILENLEEETTLGENPVNINASIGIALFPEHGEELEILVQRADKAMYEAKKLSKGYSIYAIPAEKMEP
jgi:diguanylate cyclase (GGDEF)-like protein/PAS domain S-box-containing protein